jgi:putative addiction module component (TIGR02574 family)
VTDRKDALNGEVEMANLAEVLRNAMSLDVHDRATFADRLLASLEELSEEDVERLWAEAAQRRLEEYRAGRAQAVPAEAVHEQAARLFR